MSTGTNKERLEQNNAKIDRLINLVKSKGAIPSKLSQVIDKSITELTAEDFGNITKIGHYAFNGCENLEQIEIPNSITEIGQHVFSNCLKLTKITVPSSVTNLNKFSLRNEGFEEVIFEEPCKITTFPAYLFSTCSNLKNINIPNTVTAIGSRAFEGCSSLTEINIPSSITSIYTYAFVNCKAVETVICEGQAPNIQDGTFSGCSAVTLYDFSNCTSVPTLANVASLGHASGCVIRVPSSLYITWITATNWSALTDVVWETVGDDFNNPGLGEEERD